MKAKREWLTELIACEKDAYLKIVQNFFSNKKKMCIITDILLKRFFVKLFFKKIGVPLGK